MSRVETTGVFVRTILGILFFFIFENWERIRAFKIIHLGREDSGLKGHEF